MSERALPQRRSLEREASLQSDALTSAATGDHRDFAFAASAEGADPAWRRAEMDIKLRMAVYGLALNPLAVDYDSSELGRIAFSKAFAPPAAGSNGSRRELADTDSVTSHDWGRAPVARGQPAGASETRMAQPDPRGGIMPLPHADLLANMSRLQKDMIERQRKLEARKAERRRLEREEELKMRDTIFTLQAAIQKVMVGFDSLDDDFDRRASSRASSQTSDWLGAHGGGHTEHNTHLDLQRDDNDTESQWRLDEEGGSGAAPAGDGDTSSYRTALHQPGHLTQEAHLPSQGQKGARRTLDQQLGGWKETSVQQLSELREVSDTSGETGRKKGAAPTSMSMDAAYSAQKMDPGGQNDESSGPYDHHGARTLLASDIGLGDPTCSPENREYWKRERRKEEEREWEQTRQRGQPAPSHAPPADEVNTVYITYDSQDPQGRKAYIGQTVGSQRRGKGVLTWQDGSKYCGEWSNDCPHGFGLEKYQNGSFYVGGFKDDARHGFGEFAVSTEMSYCGQWAEGQMHGIVYITEVHSDGQAKLIPAQAERGEVHRRPNDPLSSIISVKKKVEVAVKNAQEASAEARDLAWGMSKNATQLARHVIASRSPSPYIGLDSTFKSPIPPLTSTDGSGPGISEEAKVGKTVDYNAGTGARLRPVSAGGAPLLANGGRPPLPHSPKPNQKAWSRKRPMTANPSSHSLHSPKCPSPASPPESPSCQPAEPAVEAIAPRIKLAEDGLASVPASPAPMRPVSSKFIKDALIRDESLEVSLSEDNDASGFSENEWEAAMSLLLADGRKSDSPSCATPDELVALLLGESYTKDKATAGEYIIDQSLHSLLRSAEEFGYKVKDDIRLSASGCTSMGNARWSSPVQPDADQNPPFDESLLHSNYELNREPGSMPEVTPSHRLSTLQNSRRHVDTPPPKSTFLHGATGERTFSPFLKPSPPTAAFGISPRSLRLRPLPRSVGSHWTSTASPPASNHVHRLVPASSWHLVQGVHFDDNATRDRAPTTHWSEPGPIRTMTTTTTTTTTTTVTSTGESTTVRSVQTAHEVPHPANEDRMLVAVVTVAAAEVVASICDSVAKKMEALNRAESFVKASARAGDNINSGQAGPVKIESAAATFPASTRSPESNVGNNKVKSDIPPAAETISQSSSPVENNKFKANTPPCAETASNFSEQPKGCCKDPALEEIPIKSESTSSVGEIRGTQSQEHIHSRGSSPVRFQNIDEMYREVGVIQDDGDDDREDGFVDAFESKWTADEAARSPGGSRYVKAAAGLPPIDAFLTSNGRDQDLVSPPAELAWRLISKFSTGFGLSSQELTAYSHTFVEKSRLKCFVGFINVMGDDRWLEVQNRFLEDAAKSHGVDSEAKLFVREEAFTWVLERHSRNPVNSDFMERCGFGRPLQTIVSAAYEVTSGFERGGRSSEGYGPRSYDIIALRLLILHSFVETCWRVWQEVIIKTAIQEEGESIKDRYDESWKRHTTWGHGSIRNSQPAQSVMPGSQTHNAGEPARAHGQYISPLAQRVRPSSSKADFFRTKSGGSRPQSGRSEDSRRPMSGQPVTARVSGPFPARVGPFTLNQRQHIETQSKAKALPDVTPVATGYEALEYVRDELSRSAFANIAEAFAWFDLDRRQYVSVSEVDIGLKNLRIFGVDVNTLFALCSNVQLRHGTREPEIGEADFIRLFQWNNQLISNAKGLFLFGERYIEVSDAAKQQQKRIIDKVKAHMRLRHGNDEQSGSLQYATTDQSFVQQRRLPRTPSGKRVRLSSPKDACPSPGSNICPFCARTHEGDFMPTQSPPTEPLPPLRQEEKTRDGRPKTLSPIPVHQHNHSKRHAHRPTGKFGSPLSCRRSQPHGGANAEGRRSGDQNMQSTARLEQLAGAAGWNYDRLAQYLESGYQQFSAYSILSVMVNAVLEQDLCQHIVWSQGKAGAVPGATRPVHVPENTLLWGSHVERDGITKATGTSAGRPPRSMRVLRL